MALGDTPVIELFSVDGGPPPPGPWATFQMANTGGVKALGGVAVADDVTYQEGGFGAYRTDISTTDVEVHALIDVVPAPGLWFTLIFRVDTATKNGYGAEFNNVTGTQFDWQVVKYVAGVATQLGASVSTVFAAGDRVGVRMVGNLITQWHRPGDTGAVNTILTRTDSTYTGAGRIGMLLHHNSTQLRDFGGGSTTLVDTTPPANVANLVLSETPVGTISAAFNMPSTSDASAYKIRYKFGAAQTFTDHTDGTSFKVETAASPSAGVTATLAGFAAGQVVTVAVFVRDSTGNYNSGASSTITMATSEITGLALSEPVSGSITVQFQTPSVANFAAYEIRYKAGAAQTFSSHTDGTSFTPETLENRLASVSQTKSGFSASGAYTIGVFTRNTANTWSAGVTASITLGSLARRSPPSNAIQVVIGTGPPPPPPPPNGGPPPPPPPPDPNPTVFPRPSHDYDVARGLRTGSSPSTDESK